ncbi:MAG TPA: metal-dependent transcriptional regulator [Gemmatimonadaceae bacterium]|nr:metal-dependent transcriptional regulator [Gemmatimonadaceae bacterium]
MTPERRSTPRDVPAVGHHELSLPEALRNADASLTAPVEDYLKAIYDIQQGGAAATTNVLAERLSLAPASVSGMIRRLAVQGLLEHEPYRGARLTEAGRSAALRTLRRHRILESYLATVLGVPWDDVHAEAEQLEHAASEMLIDRMAQALGDPLFDPHGAPIPTRDGIIDETRHATLADWPLGTRGTVMSVSDKDPVMLRYLGELELRPGAMVQVHARAPYDGPIDVMVGHELRQIGPTAARAVRIAAIA